MIRKTFRSILLTVIITLLISFCLIMFALYSYVGHVQKVHLKNELALAITGVELNGEEYLKKITKKMTDSH